MGDNTDYQYQVQKCLQKSHLQIRLETLVFYDNKNCIFNKSTMNEDVLLCKSAM